MNGLDAGLKAALPESTRRSTFSRPVKACFPSLVSYVLTVASNAHFSDANAGAKTRHAAGRSAVKRHKYMICND